MKKNKEYEFEINNIEHLLFECEYELYISKLLLEKDGKDESTITRYNEAMKNYKQCLVDKKLLAMRKDFE